MAIPIRLLMVKPDSQIGMPRIAIIVSAEIETREGGLPDRSMPL